MAAKKKEDWKAEFLDELRKTANISYAARKALISRQTAYDRREKDREFAAAWDDACEEACDELEMEARRRATRRAEPSDTLLIFLLKANRPEKYRETTKIIGGGKGGEIIVVRLGPGQSLEDL